MYIRLKNAKTAREINLLAHNISSFEPDASTEGSKGSQIYMNNGMSFVVEESPRTVRSAIRKLSAEEVVTTDAAPAETPAQAAE